MANPAIIRQIDRRIPNTTPRNQVGVLWMFARTDIAPGDQAAQVWPPPDRSRSLDGVWQIVRAHKGRQLELPT